MLALHSQLEFVLREIGELNKSMTPQKGKI